LYTIPYYEVTLAFLVRAGEVGLYSSTGDFTGKNVGAQAGTTGWDLAIELYEDTGTNILDFPMITDLLLALEGGTVDVGIFDTPTARYYADEEPGKFAVVFTHKTHALLPDFYAYGVRPEDGTLAKVINTVIVKKMESGELTDIMEEWGVTP
jgi:ABC-type amino acid transport substrate-binding protein